MKKIWGVAIAVTAAVGLSGCGGGGSAATKTVTATSTVTRPATTVTESASMTPRGKYKGVEELRDDLTKAKVACGEWVKMTIPDIAGASEEGICSQSLTLVTFADSELAQKAMAYQMAIKDANDVAGATDSADANVTYVVGKGWAAQGQELVVELIQEHLGGQLADASSGQ